MGLVESAPKDRWLYVVAGPLAGKQFILYKSETSIGSRQESDIYLFKDPNILPRHAVISIGGEVLVSTGVADDKRNRACSRVDSTPNTSARPRVAPKIFMRIFINGCLARAVRSHKRVYRAFRHGEI
jgi:hypothetical protein